MVQNAPRFAEIAPDIQRILRGRVFVAHNATFDWGFLSFELQRAQDRLQELRPIVQRVVDQTGARLLGGDTHVADKVLSIFEPHTETIRKGKIAKPNEFGKLVTIQESEHQIITGYDVHTTRPADVTLWYLPS